MTDRAVRSTKEAAHYVGLGLNAFRAAVKRGEIAAIKDGGHPRFLVADLDAYLQRKRHPARTELRQERQTSNAGRSGRLIQLPSGINPITKRPYGAPVTGGGR